MSNGMMDDKYFGRLVVGNISPSVTLIIALLGCVRST
jgi:hypothetical protein